MERLILLRHGEAEAAAPSGRDYDRPLTGRGQRDSALVARALARDGFAPDLALVSPAARADQTWRAAASAFPAARIEWVQALYDAEPHTLLAEAEQRGGASRTVMVVAHNPGLHHLALSLAQRMKDSPDRARLYPGFPTAAAVVFDLTGERLLALLTPKALGGGA